MALAFAASTLRLHFGISVAQPYMILSLQSPSTAMMTALFDSNATSQFDFQNFSGGLAHLILGIAKITFESKFLKWIT